MGCTSGGTTNTTTNPVYYGPYGTGVQTQGETNANAISDASQPAFAQSQAIAGQTAGMAAQNAQNPGYANASSMYNNEIQGKYLNGSPALTTQENSNQTQANRAAGDQAAQIKSGDQRAGMGFSTADQQAQQGAQAQQNANAMNTNAQLIGSNYTNERNIQNQAPSQLNSNLSNQLNMNQAGISALYSPLTAQGSLNSAIYSGGSVATPDSTVTQNPSGLDLAGQVLGML